MNSARSLLPRGSELILGIVLVVSSAAMSQCKGAEPSLDQAALPQTAGKTTSTNLFENTLGMRFVAVPGTTVSFAIWETRVSDYQVFAEGRGASWSKPDFEQGPDHPAVNVSWEDATAFCAWLTAKERKAGKLPGNQRYRLPDDREWSIAAGLMAEQGTLPEERMKTASVWPWGHYWPPLPGDGNYAEELGTDKFAQTSPVGSFKPNRNGLYDLGGNVWEWCENWYNGAHVTKTLRGGSFSDSGPGYLLTSYRFSGTMNLSNEDIGFRVVLDTGK